MGQCRNIIHNHIISEVENMLLVAAAAVFLSDGTKVPSLHPNEYVYAEFLIPLLAEEAEYNKKRDAMNAASLKAYHDEKDEFSKQLRAIENQHACIVTEHFPHGDVRRRHSRPHQDKAEKEACVIAFNTALVKLGPAPTLHVPISMSFWLYLRLTKPAAAAFIMHHSAVVSAFLTGEEGWHRLFFGEKMECFKRGLPTLVRLEAVRQMFLLTHKFSTETRASLPSVDEFVEWYYTIPFN